MRACTTEEYSSRRGCVVLAPYITHRSIAWFDFILSQFWKQKIFIVDMLPAERVRLLEYGQAPALWAMLAGLIGDPGILRQRRR
jgi:hypothetical protein